MDKIPEIHVKNFSTPFMAFIARYRTPEYACAWTERGLGVAALDLMHYRELRVGSLESGADSRKAKVNA